MVGPEQLQRSYDAAVLGDMDPLVSLFALDLDWSGLERGRWWWRTAPA
jgi:ketosteroid isomerase-like protein